MLRHRTLALLRLRGLLPTSLHGWLLVGTAALYLLTLAMALFISSDVGVNLILATNVATLALGPRAFFTLGGWVQWGRLRTWGRVLVVGVFCMGYVAPGVVLFRVIRQARRDRQAMLAARPGQIAALEHELGMDRPPQQVL